METPRAPAPLPSLAASHAKRPAPGAMRTMLTWTPVAIALVLLAQVALLGLRPAFAERRRLAIAEQEMRARLEREERAALEVERLQRAHNDPIYLERERRALRAAPPAEAGSEAPPQGARPESDQAQR